jgi:hypothetical protein
MADPLLTQNPLWTGCKAPSTSSSRKATPTAGGQKTREEVVTDRFPEPLPSPNEALRPC